LNESELQRGDLETIREDQFGMNSNELRMEVALECVVGHCYDLVQTPAIDDLFLHKYGAAVELDSGSCLFVPGIYVANVETRIKQFITKSGESIAAWASQIAIDSSDCIEIHLRWGSKNASIKLPLTTPDFKGLLSEVNWESSQEHWSSEPVEKKVHSVRMSIRKAEQIFRNYIDGERFRDLLNSDSDLTQPTVGDVIKIRGWFIDRHNCDMFFNRFFGRFFGESSPVATDFKAVRERLEFFSNGRKAVSFGMAKYSNGIPIETKIWHKKMPFWFWG